MCDVPLLRASLYKGFQVAKSWLRDTQQDQWEIPILRPGTTSKNIPMQIWIFEQNILIHVFGEKMLSLVIWSGIAKLRLITSQDTYNYMQMIF